MTASPLSDVVDRLLGQHTRLRPQLGAVAADVEHQPGPLTGLAVDRQPGQLLQRLEHLAALADQGLQVGADDRHRRTVAFDVHVQVAIEVGDVEQFLEVVGGDVALGLELP